MLDATLIVTVCGRLFHIPEPFVEDAVRRYKLVHDAEISAAVNMKTNSTLLFEFDTSGCK